MKKIYEGYNQVERIILGLIMGALIIMGFAQVVFRFVLHVPLAWAEELMMFCMVWVAYLGASTAANERKHIMVSMFVDMLPPGPRKAFTVLSQILWLACSGVLIYLGYHITANYITRQATTLGGKFPFWICSIVIPVGMLMVSVRVILLIIHTLRGESDTRSTEEIVREETEA